MRQIFWAVSLSATILAPAQAHAQTVLKVWGERIGPNDHGTAEVVRRFELEHPGVRIEMLDMGAGAMNPQKLLSAIVGGAPPDVVYQDRFSLSDWAARGAFQPLEGFIKRDSADPSVPDPDDYYPAPWAEAVFQGRLYGIPWKADTRALYWNKSVFRGATPKLRAAGLDPDRPPQNWSELKAYSRALTEFNSDGTLKRAGFLPIFGNSWLYLFAFQNNASFVSADGRTCTMDSPEVQEALGFIKECYDIVGGYDKARAFQATFRGESEDPFFVGQVAMKIDGDWFLNGVVRFAPSLRFGTAPAPVPDDRLARRGRFANEPDRFITWCGGFAYCIPRGAKNSELAWEFIKYATSFEGRMVRLRAGASINVVLGIPTVPDMSAHRFANEAGVKEFLVPGSDVSASTSVHVSLLPAARIRPVTVVGQALWDEQVRATERALNGEATIADSLAESNVKVQKLLDDVSAEPKRPTVDMTGPSIVLTAGLCVFLWWLCRKDGKSIRTPLAKRESRWGWVFVAPWVVGLIAFTAGPMVFSLLSSFTHDSVLQPAKWVGTENYQALSTVERASLTKALANVTYMCLVGIPLSMITSLAVALLLGEDRKGSQFFRAAFYVPAVVPSVAAVFLWMWLLHPDPAKGAVNFVWSLTIGDWFGLPAPAWFGAEEWAKPGLVLMGVFGAGSGFLVWLAGLRGIPKQTYEAATIDGAGSWRQFVAVTLPYLSPLILFNAVAGVIGGIQTFDAAYIVSGSPGAAPNDTLLFPVVMLFRQGFHEFRMGQASALAWLLFLVIAAVTSVQFWLGKRFVFYEGK